MLVSLPRFAHKAAAGVEVTCPDSASRCRGTSLLHCQVSLEEVKAKEEYKHLFGLAQHLLPEFGARQHANALWGIATLRDTNNPLLPGLIKSCAVRKDEGILHAWISAMYRSSWPPFPVSTGPFKGGRLNCS